SRAELRRVLITASGGPFRTMPLEELARVTPASALRHPTWRMGPKITIDSATLTNKGFEVVEARWLYDLTYERIEVVIHPELIGLVAADEVAVERFLRGDIPFAEIAVYLHRGAALGRAHARDAEPSLAQLRHIDAEVRGALREEAVVR